MLEKATTVKRYSPVGSELEKQIDIAKKKCHGSDKVHEFDEENDF